MPFVFKDGSVAGVCKVCGAPSRTPRSNVCLEHYDPAKATAKKKKKTPPKAPPARDGEKPLAARVVETAGEITRSTFSGKPPTASEWEEKLTAFVVLATMTYVEFGVVRPLHMGGEAANRAIEELGMTDAEARSIVEPFSHMLAKSKISKDHGREALEVLAFAPALLAVMEWTSRVAEFRRTMTPGATPVYQGGPDDGSARRIEDETAAGGPAVANYGGPGVWEPDQAPTAGVAGDGSHVVRPYLG